LQSAVAEQAEDAIVPEVVASRLAGVGHATDGQSVQNRWCRVRVHARARRLSSAFGRPVFVAADLHAASAATVTIFAATVAILTATVTVCAATVATPVVAATAAATATDAQTTASAAAAATTFREDRGRPSGHTRIVSVGRATHTPPPADAGTAAGRQAGEEQFDEGERQEPVPHVQREDRVTGRRHCPRFRR